jgi:hypothetical protein
VINLLETKNWAIPMIKKWGEIWYLIGIAGTTILIIMCAVTRMPGNPTTGRGGPLNETLAMFHSILYEKYLSYHKV